jgi:sentrin-specific protease 1
VINFYMSMLKERDVAFCTADPQQRASWFFNSFFFAKLLGNDGSYTYANVNRWSKKFDVFAMNKVYFPVNISNTHWTLLVIYVQQKRIHYYDSMSGSGRRYLEGALRWLVDEALYKKSIRDYDVSDWTLVDREPHVPQQINGFDCGVFTIMCADFLSDTLPLNYSQEDVSFFRRKIAADILRGSLNYE